MGVGEGVGKCIGVWGEMRKGVEKCAGEKCVGVWESVGRSVGKCRKYEERCGGGEGKCLGVNVKNLVKCVRVWREVWRV